MFPKNPVFICRTCNTLFSIKAEDFPAIKLTGHAHCPECKQIFPIQTAKQFFRHYEILVKMVNALVEDGFDLSEVYSEKIKEQFAGMPKRHTIKGAMFRCTKCHGVCGGNIEKTMEEWPANTDLIQCRDCGTKPRPIAVTEFFKALYHVNQLQVEFSVFFQLDLFSHRGMDLDKIVKKDTEGSVE